MAVAAHTAPDGLDGCGLHVADCLNGAKRLGVELLGTGKGAGKQFSASGGGALLTGRMSVVLQGGLGSTRLDT